MALAIVAVTLSACGGGSSEGNDAGTPPPTNPLLGSWLYSNGNRGAGLTFTAAADYSFAVIALTGTTSANMQMETGIYFLHNSSDLELTPQQSSCPGQHPAYQETVAVTTSSLTLSDSTGVIVFVPNNYAASSAAITYGCFDSSGNFTASPLVAVSP